MTYRALMFSLILAAVPPAAGRADQLAPSVNVPPDQNVILPDGGSKVPNNVPEVIRQPGDTDQSKAATDPAGALQPPPLNANALTQTASGGELEIDFLPWAKPWPYHSLPPGK